jgi:N-acetyl-beta-hexosaminidase
MKLKIIRTGVFMLIYTSISFAQNILPTPVSVNAIKSNFNFGKIITIAYESEALETATYLESRLEKNIKVKIKETNKGDIVLVYASKPLNLGSEGYLLHIDKKNITIESNSNAGLFYGVQSLLQLLPFEVQSGKQFDLTGFSLAGIEIKDSPKYSWRSFMLDSGRQYQTPEFIKKYLNHMAMLKMNVFHWHLTEGQGWRIEIKKYPKLTEIGSKVANGKEQHGFYTQDEIRDIVAYASKLHIIVVPEIDVPGHSEAALIAYPELSCFGIAPETVMTFSPNLFCAGNEKTYVFLQNVLDEVSDLFPSQYIHLGGDEAPKGNWNKCPNCLDKIKKSGLKDTHDLQQSFSSRLANYLKQKEKKVIFWGDVIYNGGNLLPDNVIIQWWNFIGHGDLAMQNAIKMGYPVICSTNQYTYLNFTVSPWGMYQKSRNFDMKMAYEENRSNLSNPNKLILGMGASLWTDWNVTEELVDRRVFPRIFVLAEQMWNSDNNLSFELFYKKVKEKYPLLTQLGINYGPALYNEVPNGYKWD